MSQTEPIAGRYAIIDRIDEGGMGEVFRARDQQTGAIVAVKAFKEDIIAQEPTLLARCTREAETLRRLDHPNIVRILDTILHNGRSCIVMEYVSGGSLADRLKRDGALPIAEALAIALDLSDALARTHRLQIIHRDLKPANVLLAEDGTPRLTDFGVARTGEGASLTQVGSLLGTIAYLSPEVIERGDYSEKSDIWAFGLILYEMLTARHPYEALTVGDLLSAILRKPIPDARIFRQEIPPAVSELLNAMLAKRPEDRIASIRDVGARLEHLMASLNAAPAAQPAASASDPFSGDLTSSVRAVTRPVGDPRVFLSYRREDSGAITQGVYDQLVAVLGAANVVRDLDRLADRTIARYVLANDVVGSVDALIVLIGDGWAGVRGKERAIDNPKDPIRMQIEVALRRTDMLILPILIGGATLPNNLPPALEALRTLTPFALNPDAPLEAQTRKLVKRLYDNLGIAQQTPLRRWLVIGFLVVALLMGILGAGAVALTRAG